jgi:hypothetical protein
VSKDTFMTDSRDLSSPLAWRRTLLALVAGLALAFGMVAPHDVAVELAGVVSQVEIAETAVHPGAPAHFEASELKTHPGCVACLLQLGSSTVLSLPPALLSPLPQDGYVAAPAAQVSAVQPPLPGPARAPPTASPSA